MAHQLSCAFCQGLHHTSNRCAVQHPCQLDAEKPVRCLEPIPPDEPLELDRTRLNRCGQGALFEIGPLRQIAASCTSEDAFERVSHTLDAEVDGHPRKSFHNLRV